MQIGLSQIKVPGVPSCMEFGSKALDEIVNNGHDVLEINALVRVVSKSTNELKTGPPGRFGLEVSMAKQPGGRKWPAR